VSGRARRVRGGRGPRVVVVGGGITGLATAWHLREHAEVVVLEAGPRLGGQIHTIELAGVPVDVGADALLARQPEGVALVRALGLGEELVAPRTSAVDLWIDGRRRPLPEATVLGAPTDLRALVRSRVLGPGALARAAIEPLLPRRVVAGDRSVADLVGERFGRQVVDRLVEPLLGGVYAGNSAELSAAAAAPPIAAAAREHRSVTVGLLAHRRRVRDSGPVFQTVRGGLSRLVAALASPLGEAVRTGEGAAELQPSADGWEVTTSAGTELTADHVVLTTPAAVSAALLAPIAPAAARELATIRTASVGVIALAYAAAAAVGVPDRSGLLVPRSEGRLIKAVTFASGKWPHHAERDVFLVRASVGRIDDTSALELPDDELAERVDAEVRWATGIRATAGSRRVVRWNDALPQYDVGHLRRVERIRVALADAPPGLHVGGAPLDGVGLAARARDAQRMADAIRAAVGAR
jgi:protoporphyrinogen/coproporphyrinogen III oxidase